MEAENTGRQFEGRRRLGTVYFKEAHTCGILSLSGEHVVDKCIASTVSTIEFSVHDLVEFILSEDFSVITRRITHHTMKTPFAGFVVGSQADHIAVCVAQEGTTLQILKPRDLEELYKGDLVAFAYDTNQGQASNLVLIEKTPVGRPVFGECPVCFEEKTLFTISNCEHVMCSECTTEWLLSVYKDLNMEKFYCFSSIPVKNRSKCPQCDFLMFYSNANPIGKCLGCNLHYCGQCSVTFDAHKGRTCEELRNELEMENLARERGWQKCPQCLMMIEKSSGCNHMTHNGCPSSYSGNVTHFCYCCGALLQDSRTTPDGQVHFALGLFQNCINK